MRNEYAHHKHFEWVEGRTKQKCSPLGRKVANILGYVGCGIYNCPISHRRIDWTDDYCIVVNWGHELSSWDAPELAKLFILCTREMIRVSIEPSSPTYLKLMFWQRKSRDGGMSKQLPDVETIVKMVDDDFSEVRE